MLQERRLFPRLQRNIRQQASIKDKTVHDNVPPKQTPLTDKTQSPSSKKKHPTLIGKHSLRNKQFNSTVLTLLRKYAQDQNKSWVTILKYATFIYNSTCHQSTQQSPLKLLHGIDTIEKVYNIDGTPSIP